MFPVLLGEAWIGQRAGPRGEGGPRGQSWLVITRRLGRSLALPGPLWTLIAEITGVFK